MKMIKFLMPATIILALLLPVGGFAQQDYPNEIGLFLSEEGTGPYGVVTNVLEPVTLYVILHRPTDVDAPGGPTPFDFVQSFEFMLTFDNPAPLLMTSLWIPPGAINIGDVYNFNSGYLDFFVGGSEPRPVIDESILLAWMTFLPMSLGVTEVFMGPSMYPSIEGQMTYLPPDPPLQAMYSISGSHDDPVFIFNGMAVAVENESFGSVKALYR